MRNTVWGSLRLAAINRPADIRPCSMVAVWSDVLAKWLWDRAGDMGNALLILSDLIKMKLSMNMLVFVSVVCYEYLKDDVPFQRLVTFPLSNFVCCCLRK